MSFFENLRTALLAISTNKLRGLLTMLGVIIGVYAVSTMIALGQMATATVTKELNQIGGSQLMIYPRPQPGRRSSLPFESDDLIALHSLPVTDISMVNTNLSLSSPQKSSELNSNGVWADYLSKFPSVKLMSGRFISAREVEDTAPVIVLNAVAAKRYFGTEAAVGRTLRYKQSLTTEDGQPRPPRYDELTVIGVIQEQGSLFGAAEASGYLPISYIWRSLGTRGTYYSLMLKLNPGADAVSTAAAITQILSSRRGSTDFEVQNFDQFVAQFKQITSVLQLALSAIGGLSLLVGGIGIMNIMLVSVTERTREIGLRKALGARRSTVLTQFLIEAVTLTGLGGVIGYILSALTILAVTFAVPNYFPTFSLSPAVAALALGVSVGTGLVFGVWPAQRASRLTPIEALRHE